MSCYTGPCHEETWANIDTPYLARKGEVWGVICECKSDQSLTIVVLSALLYHISLQYIESLKYSIVNLTQESVKN